MDLRQARRVWYGFAAPDCERLPVAKRRVPGGKRTAPMTWITGRDRLLTEAGMKAARVLLTFAIALGASAGYAAPGDMTTVAGAPGEGTALMLGQNPVGVAVHGSAVYVA